MGAEKEDAVDLILDQNGVKNFKQDRRSLLSAATLGVVVALFYLFLKDEPISKTFAVLVGNLVMMGSSGSVLLPNLAPYAEWVTAGGVTMMVACCAVADMWLPAIYGGIIFANWLSIIPGLAVCIVNTVAYTTVAGVTNTEQLFLLSNAVFFVMNKLSMEETKSEAQNLQRQQKRGHEDNVQSVADMDESVKSIRRVNQVLLETLRPSSGGVGSGVVEELVERLDFLQGTMPGIDQELQPCKALLKDFLSEAEALKTPPTKGKAGKKLDAMDLENDSEGSPSRNTKGKKAKGKGKKASIPARA